MAFDPQTVSEIRDLLLAAKAVQDPELDTSEGSDAWLDANAQATRINELQIRIAEVHDAILPSTATGDDLDAHGTVWGVARLGATRWSGQVKLQTLVAGTTVPAGSTLSHADGTQYQTLTDVLPATWAGGFAYPYAEAITYGTVANKADATAIILDSPPAGVSADAWIYATGTAAIDVESATAYRARILLVTAGRPGSGNCADYLAWARSVSGVADAFVYPRWDGLCTLRVIPLGPAGSRYPSASLVTNVQTAIDAGRPCAATVLVQAPNATYISLMVMTITTADGYGPDWTGTLTEDPGVVSNNTRVYTTANPNTVGLTSGMRVVIRVAATPNFHEQRVVDTVYADGFDVTVPLSDIPANNSTIYSGGPVWQDTADAIDAVFDGLGPAESTDSGRQRYPSDRGDNPSALYLSDLYAAVNAVEGIVACTITTPAADTPRTDDPGVQPKLTMFTGWLEITWA